MEIDAPFDRALRRLRRDRALASGAADPLAGLIGEELLDRLEDVKRHFATALLLGCSDNRVSTRLEEQAVRVVAADPGFAFAASASGVQCDEDRLPFGDQSFDLVICAGGLDSVNDLPGALTLIRRTLRADGLFLAGLVGAGSLPRLRSAMLAADGPLGTAPHIHPQIDVRAAGDLLARAGFALPVAENHGYRIRYADMMSLVRDLRSTSSTNLLTSRSRRTISRPGLERARVDFTSHAESDGKITEHLEILYLTAWAPSPDQPRPAVRGSATHSLATALRSRLRP